MELDLVQWHLTLVALKSMAEAFEKLWQEIHLPAITASRKHQSCDVCNPCLDTHITKTSIITNIISRLLSWIRNLIAIADLLAWKIMFLQLFTVQAPQDGGFHRGSRHDAQIHIVPQSGSYHPCGKRHHMITFKPCNNHNKSHNFMKILLHFLLFCCCFSYRKKKVIYWIFYQNSESTDLMLNIILCSL